MEDTHLNIAKLVCPLSYIHAKIHSTNKQTKKQHYRGVPKFGFICSPKHDKPKAHTHRHCNCSNSSTHTFIYIYASLCPMQGLNVKSGRQKESEQVQQYIINEYYESFLDKNKEIKDKENKNDMGTSIKMTCAANKVVKCLLLQQILWDRKNPYRNKFAHDCWRQ